MRLRARCCAPGAGGESCAFVRRKMTVLYVDVEHERVMRDPDRAPAHAAGLETARNRLAGAARTSCSTVRFNEISARTVARHAPSALVISGSSTEWEAYDFAEFAGL